MQSEFLQIGAIRRAHGVRGQLRIQLHNPLSTALHALARVLLGPDEAAPRAGALRAFDLTFVNDLGGGAHLVQLAGVSDRDAAEALRGLSVYVRRQDLPPLSDDEFYLADLIGCTVVGTDGAPAGVVREVQSLAGQDMLVVSREDREDALLPLVPEIVVSVDLAARQVHIDPPEGLLDLDQPGER